MAYDFEGLGSENAKQIARMLDRHMDEERECYGGSASPEVIAEWLDAHGVAAPGVNDDRQQPTPGASLAVFSEPNTDKELQVSDEPKLRHQGDWEKINHISKIIETEYENESMALWAAEAIFQYVNENPSVSVHYIRRRMAEAWDECCDAVSTQGTVQLPANPYRDHE